jgi:hypothetical protein
LVLLFVVECICPLYLVANFFPLCLAYFLGNVAFQLTYTA